MSAKRRISITLWMNNLMDDKKELKAILDEIQKIFQSAKTVKNWRMTSKALSD